MPYDPRTLRPNAYGKAYIPGQGPVQMGGGAGMAPPSPPQYGGGTPSSYGSQSQQQGDTYQQPYGQELGGDSIRKVLGIYQPPPPPPARQQQPPPGNYRRLSRREEEARMRPGGGGHVWPFEDAPPSPGPVANSPQSFRPGMAEPIQPSYGTPYQPATSDSAINPNDNAYDPTLGNREFYDWEQRNYPGGGFALYNRDQNLRRFDEYRNDQSGRQGDRQVRSRPPQSNGLSYEDFKAARPPGTGLQTMDLAQWRDATGNLIYGGSSEKGAYNKWLEGQSGRQGDRQVRPRPPQSTGTPYGQPAPPAVDIRSLLKEKGADPDSWGADPNQMSPTRNWLNYWSSNSDGKVDPALQRQAQELKGRLSSGQRANQEAGLAQADEMRRRLQAETAKKQAPQAAQPWQPIDAMEAWRQGLNSGDGNNQKAAMTAYKNATTSNWQKDPDWQATLKKNKGKAGWRDPHYKFNDPWVY